MSWVKLDDKRALNAKLTEAGLEARGLDEAAICWCAQHQTDGFIPADMVRALGAGHRHPNALGLAKKRVEGVNGWQIVGQT